MSDIAGIFIGIPGLINDIFELRERWDAAADNDSESKQALHAWEDSLVRLQDWIEYAGFDGVELKKVHHRRLDDPARFERARQNLVDIRKNCEWLHERLKKIKAGPVAGEKSSLLAPTIYAQDVSRSRPRSPLGFRADNIRDGLRWAMHGRQFWEKVNKLERIINRLYESFPNSSRASGRPEDTSENPRGMVAPTVDSSHF